MNIKINWLAFFVLFFPVLIDAVNGYLSLEGGRESSLLATLYKGTILVYSFKYVLRSRYSSLIKSLFGVYLCCFFYQSFCYGASLSDFIRIIYPFFVAGLCLTHSKLKDTKTCYNYLLAYGVVAALIIIFCSFTGFGYNQYGALIGNRGLFRAGNDIGLAMLLLNCIAIYMYQHTNKICYLVCFLLLSSACLLIATTAGITGTFLIFLGVTISVFLIKNKDYRPVISIKIGLILFVCFVVTYVFSFLIDSIQSVDYLSNKFENVETRFTESSGRSVLIESAQMAFQRFSFFDWVFGASNFYHYFIGEKLLGTKMLASAEVDFYDMIGSYGIVCTVLLIFFPIKYVWLSIVSYYKSRSIELFWILWINMLFISCAFYAGHAFTAITPFTIFMVVNSLNFYKRKNMKL